MCTRVRTCIHVHVYVHVHVSAYVYVHVYVYAYGRWRWCGKVATLLVFRGSFRNGRAPHRGRG